MYVDDALLLRRLTAIEVSAIRHAHGLRLWPGQTLAEVAERHGHTVLVNELMFATDLAATDGRDGEREDIGRAAGDDASEAEDSCTSDSGMADRDNKPTLEVTRPCVAHRASEVSEASGVFEVGEPAGWRSEAHERLAAALLEADADDDPSEPEALPDHGQWEGHAEAEAEEVPVAARGACGIDAASCWSPLREPTLRWSGATRSSEGSASPSGSRRGSLTPSLPALASCVDGEECVG